ncbi:hypothetical protein N8T08_005613 [Aspergillus melleus]|uniref:Uncharacterized protein n=1 Tax=Aspergillus melleus TaxID=138277 RepID=A0ACC3B1I8_9EURO|nr:hypothetical protein N8T08_005613 [Aspergillus melleus]
MMVLDMAGWDAFADFNKQYRRSASKAGFQVPGHLFLDNLSESTIRIANLDVLPFVQISNGHISPVQLEPNQSSQIKPLYPLSLLIQGETLAKLQEDLKLQNSFNLVEGQQPLASGVDGDIRLRSEVNEFEQIYGKSITLLDGARVVREVMVQDSLIEFPGLLIGVYALRLPTGRNRKYESPDHRYLIVKPGSTEVKVAFEPKTASSLASQKIHLPGLAGLIFGTIIVDQVNQILEIAVTRKSPHSYYGSKTHAEIIINDNSGKEKFRATIPGAGAELSYDKIAFELGYTLQIYHAELNRPVVLTPAYEGIFDPKAKTDKFDITASGLRNSSPRNDPLKEVLNRIDMAATELRSRPSMLRAEPTAKIDIWLAMDLFPGSERNVDFKGIGDRRFLKVDLDLNRRKLTYMDVDGNELLSMDIKGITNQKTKEWPLSISGYGGEVLKIRHEEPNTRLVVTNNMQNRRLSSREKLQNYRIISTGLERIA